MPEPVSKSNHQVHPDATVWGPCPDGGTCHHQCQAACFRVQCCGPLSGVYPRNTWPPEVVQAHGGLRPLAKGDRVTVRGTVWQVAPDCDTLVIELDHGNGLIAVDAKAARPESEA